MALRTCSPRLLLCLMVESTSDLSLYTVCLLWTPLMALEPVPLDSYCAWWWSLLLISLSVYCMSVMDSPDGTRTCSPRLLLCLVVESTSDLSLYTVFLLWTPLMALRTCSPRLLLCLVVESTSDLHGDGPPLVQALSVRLSVHRHPRNEVLGRQFPPTTNTNSYNYRLSYLTFFFMFLILIYIYTHTHIYIYIFYFILLLKKKKKNISIYISIYLSISISIYMYVYIYPVSQSLLSNLCLVSWCIVMKQQGVWLKHITYTVNHKS